MNVIINIFKESINLWLEVSPYLLLGLIMSGIIHIFLGKEFISNHLGKGGILSVVKAALFGVPLPVCSCGVIPLASSLRKEGAHKSSVLSFLVSTPTTGVDSFLATYSLMGPLFAIFRPLGALISGITLGIVDYFVEGKKEKLVKIPKHSHGKTSHIFKLKEFLKFSFVEIPQDIGKWLILGVFLGGAISALIPQELFARYLGFPLDFVVALAVGIPLYVCATGSIPIAASLIQKGFSPGAALVFLIVGPATNTITLSFVRAKLGKKSFYLYLGSIIVVAVILGLAFNYLWVALGKDIADITGMGKMLPANFKTICAIILFLMVITSVRKKDTCAIDVDLEIKIKDIHCGHCKLALKNAFKDLPGLDHLHIDTTHGLIKIKGQVDKQEALKRVRDAGYHPE